MAIDTNGIVTRGECNSISSGGFGSDLDRCPTKSEINATNIVIVLESGVTSNDWNLTALYDDNQLVKHSDVGQYVNCLYTSTIPGGAYLEFYNGDELKESFYPFIFSGDAGGSGEKAIGLTDSFFKNISYTDLKIRANFGSSTYDVITYSINDMKGAKSEEGDYFEWGSSSASDIMQSLANAHEINILVSTTSDPVHTQNFYVEPSSYSIDVNGTKELAATYAELIDGVIQTNGFVTTACTWTSSDSTNVSVGEKTGIITGIKAGSTAKITASYTNSNGLPFSDFCDVTVNQISVTRGKLSFVTTASTATDNIVYCGFSTSQFTGTKGTITFNNWYASNCNNSGFTCSNVVLTDATTGVDYLEFSLSNENDWASGYYYVKQTDGNLNNYVIEVYITDENANNLNSGTEQIVKPNVYELGLSVTTYTVSGKVTDTNGEPLIGATVMIKGTSIGTSTDVEGDYILSNLRFDYFNNGTLVFSYVGYVGQEIAINGKKTIDVTLLEQTGEVTLESIAFDWDAYTSGQGGYSYPNVIATYSDSTTKNVTSSCTFTITDSSTSGVCNWNSTANTLSHGAIGTATLNASYTEGSITKTATVPVETVKVIPTSVILTPSPVSVAAGETVTVDVTMDLNNGYTGATPTEEQISISYQNTGENYIEASLSGNTISVKGKAQIGSGGYLTVSVTYNEVTITTQLVVEVTEGGE